MANNIKGITIEIGGDTSPLEKALKDVNKTSRDLQGELKEVNRQLKFDPSNTELLNQKQKLLSESITNTKSKLDTLKEAEKQAQVQFKEGKISEEQYRALQREVIKTESQLKNLVKQAGESNAALKKIADTTKNIGDNAGKVASKMAPASAAIVGAGAAAVAAWDEVDSGMDVIIKKTGATGDAAKDFEKIYKDLGSSVPDDLSNVGAAIGEINTRLDFTGEKLRKSSEDFLKFAKINDIDVNSAVQLVTRAMGDAGIKADDYNQVLDMLTVAAQKSGISIESLTTNLAKYGAPMRALGVDTETSIAMFAGWEKAGVNTEIAFSGMKKAISTWGAAGKDSTKEFAKALEEIKKAPDIASATTMAIEIFGAKAGPDLADAIKGGRFEVQDYIEALKNAGGTVDATYTEIVDGADDAKTAMNASKVAASEFGSIIMTSLAPILQGIALKAKELAEKFANLDDGTKKIILVILGLIAAISPVAKIIQGIMVIVGGATTLIGTISGAIGLLTGTLTVATPAATALAGAITFLTGPVGIAIAVIGAIIAVGVLLYKNWDTIKVKAGELGSYLGDKFNGIKESVISPIRTAADFIGGQVDRIKSFFSGLRIELPSIKLPHFKLSGEFSLMPPRIPTVGVDWYDKGGIFSSPKIIGVGEKRPEFVGALEDLRYLIGDELKKVFPDNPNNFKDTYITFPFYVSGEKIAETTVTYNDLFQGRELKFAARRTGL